MAEVRLFERDFPGEKNPLSEVDKLKQTLADIGNMRTRIKDEFFALSGFNKDLVQSTADDINRKYGAGYAHVVQSSLLRDGKTEYVIATLDQRELTAQIHDLEQKEFLNKKVA